MSTNLPGLHDDLAAALKFFQTNLDAREMPCMHSFPDGSCERVSALLAVALARKYRSARVAYVKGRNRSTGEMHFWVEVDDLVIDPTAHQYDQYETPLICALPSPLEAIFQRDEVHLDPQVSTDLLVNSNGLWDTALAALCSAINA